MKKFLAKLKNLFWAFMELDKVYRKMNMDALWQVLRLYGVGCKLLKAVRHVPESEMKLVNGSL